MASFQTPQKCEKGRFGLKTLTIPPSPFLEKLGYGTGVNVWKLNNSPRSGGTSPWAMKNVRSGLSTPFNKRYQSLIKKEAAILASINHENIITFKGYYTSEDGRNCLAMEKCGVSLGDLIEQRLENESGPFPSQVILKVALHVAKALKYLHTEKKILHGDIKSYNVLVQGDFDVIKLCDFGVCCKIDKKGFVKDFVGTPVYSAPEAQEDEMGLTKPITSKADIFSLGLVLWEMLALIPPHSEDINDGSEVLSLDDSVICLGENGDGMNESCSDVECHYGTRPALPDVSLGPDYNPVLEIFHCCTEQDPAKRPTAQFLVQHLQTLLKTL